MPKPSPSRFTWRKFFDRSSSAVFVFGGNRRLRYANAAWEQATGESLTKLRGSKVSAVRPLISPLAPPPEVWAGRQAAVRRAAPGYAHGPPWWDITFLPLLGPGGKRVIGVIGFLTVVGVAKSLPRVWVPEAVAAERATHAERFSFTLLDGPSAMTQRLASQARAAAIGETSVWIVGEPGSGKETLARVIHHNSPRRDRGFVGLNCGGIQPYLIEGMLFGKGGLAGGPHAGTLYLKNPVDLPRPLQDRILAWCESAFGPRLICGSNGSAIDLVANAGLASSFHTRHSAFEIRIPPLRERLDDLPILLSRLSEVPPMSDVLEVLKAYPWPGNIRELIEIVTQANPGPLSRDQVPRVIRERHLIATSPLPREKPPPHLDTVLEAVERRLIESALTATEGHLTQAAQRLGVFRSRLTRRMDALGIPNPWPVTQPGGANRKSEEQP
jgi:transcriptional regulator with PAS, ATPase and Fis domain